VLGAILALWCDDRFMAGPQLRGRAAEQAILADLMAGAADGAAGVVLIDGPAGIGKSRLVEDAARLAAEHGFIVAAARSDELDQVTPLGPLVTALRASEPPIIGSDDRLLIAGLADQRLWLLERLRGALESAAVSRPVLISIDDMQWADQATLQAAAALPAQLFSVPIAWVLARRTAPVTSAMHALLGRLAGLGARRIGIGPLAPDAVLELASDMLGAIPDGPLSRLMDKGQGNPFYLTELLATLVDTGRIVIDHGQARLRGDGLPEQFHASVRSHIRGLSPGAQRLLQVASVFGTDFAVADLAAVMGQASGHILGPVLEATGTGLLVEHSPTALGFRHDLIRHAIYSELPGPVRQSLHRDTATALSRSGAAASRVAAHLAQGARPGDEEALRLLDQAAAALAPTNPSAAADAACQALDLLPAGDPRHAQAATTAVQLLGDAGRLDEALRVADAILGDATLSPSQEAIIHLGIRRSWVMTSRRPMQRPVPRRVLEDPSVPRELSSMLLALEAAAAGHSDLAEGERLIGAASRDAEKSAEPSAMMQTLAVQAGIRSAKGELGAALSCAEQALQMMPPGPVSFPQWFVGFCLCPLDRFDEALRFFAQATHDAEQMGSPFAGSLADASRAAALLAAGRFDDAAVAAENAIDTAVLLGLGQPLGEGLRVLAEIQVRRGDLAAAKATVGQLCPLLASQQATATATWAPALLGDAQGDPARALAEVAEPLRQLAERHYRLGVPDPPQLAQLTELALRAGDTHAATTAAEAAQYLADTNPDVAPLAGVAAHARGLLGHDTELLRQAIGLLEQGRRPLATATAQEHLAGLLPGEHQAEAISLLDAAHDRYARAGASRDVNRIRSELRRYGIRRRPPAATRPRSGWGSLTAAETTVIRAIAEGLTSRQAADELFLSVHTVNTHLRNAFVKLGIRSRVELVRLVLTREQPAPWRPSGLAGAGSGRAGRSLEGIEDQVEANSPRSRLGRAMAPGQTGDP
jgi:DNA-binding CsgD family transcriptional regulator/tetratricopeptide (TPR) repeat protein